MRYAVIVSEKDLAGASIKERLLGMYGWDKKEGCYFLKENDNISLYTVKEDSIRSEDLDKEISADIFIFAARHKAKAGINSLVKASSVKPRTLVRG